MGQDGGTAGGTNVSIALQRPCSQAGSALKGSVTLKVGSDGKELVGKYPDGIVLEAQLFGAEKVYWALNMQHGEKSQKRLVPGPNRRE